MTEDYFYLLLLLLVKDADTSPVSGPRDGEMHRWDWEDYISQTWQGVGDEWVYKT